MIGIRNIFKQTTTLSVASSAALVDSQIIIPIAASQTVSAILRLFFTVGAAGGIRLQVTTPAAPTSFLASILLANTVAPSQAVAIQTASAAFTNALANAGSHWADIALNVVNGTTAGNLTLQFAQNTSDATAAQLLAGSFAEVIYT